jgi:peroxiredoxin
MIKVNDKFPGNISLKKITGDVVEDFNTSQLLKGKVAIFGVPGAFTPTCSQDHVPSFLNAVQSLKNQGVEEIYCISVNDFFVLKAWGASIGVGNKISFLADAEAQLTSALDLSLDLTSAGLGKRSKRYSMLLEDGEIKAMNVESSAGECTVSRGDALSF